jgi:class 3 adenylate cyclase
VTPGPAPPRLWQRLSVRVAAGFVAVTVLGIGLAGAWIYRTQKEALEETLGSLLLNIARTAARQIDPALHVEVQITKDGTSEAYRWLQGVLAGIQQDNQIETPIYTLSDYEPLTHRARIVIASAGAAKPGDVHELVPVVANAFERAFKDGTATQTGVYVDQRGTWITGFAAVKDRDGQANAVLQVDYRVDVFLTRLARLRRVVLGASLAGGAAALVLGLLLARHVTGPVAALTRGVARVAAGDLSESLPVRSADEVGQLTRAFNAMLEGLRQRDFIRDTFGRYVSPEVVQTLLESPEGLKLGGEKREVTVLMSDLRGYTRFVEQGEPAVVVEVLNAYLGRMTEIIVEHGGTINEFVGDGIVAFFGAPLRADDHAERAAACALAMQGALAELNPELAARGRPRLEMGIGLNTGDAIVGNVGSEKRAKYTAVGTAINLAARVEGCTVGGQVLLSPFTYEKVRAVAEVGPPLPVEVKGIKDPLLLYELRAVGGRYPRRLPEAEGGDAALAPVDLPILCWVIEGKTIRPAAVTGRAVGLGAHRLEVRLDAGQAPLAPLTNVRLRLTFPALGQDSEDVYGKVMGSEPGAEGARIRIGLTSVTAADQQIIERLQRGPGGA